MRFLPAACLCFFAAAGLCAAEQPVPLRRIETLRPNLPDTPRGDRIASITINDRPLLQVLAYLSQIGGVNIVKTWDEPTMRVTIPELKNVTWRGALEFIARKHGLRIDESRIKQGLIVVSRPERSSFTFKDTDIRDAIWAIAEAGKLNVVLDPDVKGTITATLLDVTCEDALATIVKTLGYVVVYDKPGVARVE